MNITSCPATPTAPGTYTIILQVTDSLGRSASNSFSVTITSALQVTTTSLPYGTQGIFYSNQVYAAGGQLPLSLDAVAGISRFAGRLSLSTNGPIFGTPTGTGTNSFSVRVTDGVSNTVDQALQIAVYPKLLITTTSLPPGAVSVNIHTNLQATGGLPPYNWSIISGSLPSGVNFNSGLIDGIPTVSGTFNFTVQITDQLGGTTNRALSLVIAGFASNHDHFTDQRNQRHALQPDTSSFRRPDAIYLVNSKLFCRTPAESDLGTNGILSGTLATNGTFCFYVRVTDALAAIADTNLCLTIVNPPLQVTNVSFANGTVGGVYSAQLGATGGQPLYRCWALAPGSASLPPGLSLACSGLISGTPTTNGLFNFIVRATDTNFVTADKVLGIIINPKPVLSLPTWITNRAQMRITGASNQSYTVQMSTNLSSTNWISLFTTNNTTTNSFIVTDPAATNKQRFYRIKVGP